MLTLPNCPVLSMRLDIYSFCSSFNQVGEQLKIERVGRTNKQTTPNYKIGNMKQNISKI